jgi:hypothetical protein
MLDHKLLAELELFIQEHQIIESAVCQSSIEWLDESVLEDIHGELDDFIRNNRKPTLQEVLFRFIDKKGITDAEVYKSAGLDRKHFSKIRSKPDYRPKKSTIFALALGLELNKEDTEELLGSAGYSLSESETSDLVIKFCLDKHIYDVNQVNEYLVYFSEKPLGSIV